MNRVRRSMILHVDADAFFASVEQALEPGLKGRAVIVGGSDRGVVSAASYEARRFGYTRRCLWFRPEALPHAVFLDPNFHAYSKFSHRMFGIMREYSPLGGSYSVDEGTWISPAPCGSTSASWEVANRLLCEIRSTLDINVSGGLAGTGPGPRWPQAGKAQWAPLFGA